MQHINVTTKVSFEDHPLANLVILLQPSKPILCTTKDEDGTDHVAPFGWCMPVSQEPPLLALAIHHSPEKSKTLINIERTNEFVINIPHLGIAEETIRAAFSPKGSRCKFDCSEFSREASKYISPVGIKECVSSIECKTEDIRYFGDHALIIGRIVHATFDPAAYIGKRWNVENYRPLIHLGHRCLKDGTQVHELLDGNIKSVELAFSETKKVCKE